MLIAIRHNRKLVYENLRFRDIVLDSECTDVSFNALLKKKFAHSKLARKIWDCPHLHYINQTMKMELHFLRDVLSTPEKFHWFSPIAHLIPRTPEFSVAGDACLTGAGGVSRNANFW